MSETGNVTERVMKHIKEKIVIGNWPVGSRIPSENEMCRDIGCSRTSVRAAIQKYNVLGVLETKRGKGTFVRSVDLFTSRSDKYLDLFGNIHASSDLQSLVKWRQVRYFLEPQIIYKVAQTATPELVQKLKEINREQFDTIGKQEQFINKDIEFHMAITMFLKNDLLNDIMRGLFSMRDMAVLSNEEFGYTGGSYMHMLMTDAIEQHDADRARRLMQEHQKELIEDLVVGMKTLPVSEEKKE